ncbi:hypothetical protein AHAS_Ahas11G0168900 [Arachis hypogaea]
MEFNSSYDQSNFMGYYPPSPISNGGWEYHQENTKSEHSNPGDLFQKHKMSKRIIWDIFLHHKMMQAAILMVAGRSKTRKHLRAHIPLIKSHLHLNVPSIHLCKTVQPYLPVFHLKILHHLTMPQHKNHPKTHNQHKLPRAKDSQCLSPDSTDLWRNNNNSGEN